MKKFLCFLLFLTCAFPLKASEDWMNKQIAQDLAPYEASGFCPHCLSNFQATNHDPRYCLFTIKSNQVSCRIDKRYHKWVFGDHDLPTELNYQKIDAEAAKRIRCIYMRLQEIALERPLPDTTFLLFAGDYPWQHRHLAVPMFVMSKYVNDDPKILFPDFDALASRYQVIEGIDLETTDFPTPWDERDGRIAWRGKTNQKGGIHLDDQEKSARLQICRLSEQYPDLVDAGFTKICERSSPQLAQYLKPFLKTEEIFAYKYQAWLDGDVTSYTNSGWRFYAGSTVVKPASPFTQWYFCAMKPWIHYVPVKEDLSDLIETLLYLKNHDDLAYQIAQNGLKFARTHISKESTAQYFHDLLWSWSRLESKHPCPRHPSKQ